MGPARKGGPQPVRHEDIQISVTWGFALEYL